MHIEYDEGLLILNSILSFITKVILWYILDLPSFYVFSFILGVSLLLPCTGYALAIIHYNIIAF